MSIHIGDIRKSAPKPDKCPIIFTYHTKYDIDIKKVISLKGIQKSALNLILNNIEACDEVWVVSKGAGENLRSLGYRGDYIVMRNGVDIPRAECPTIWSGSCVTAWG